MVRQPESVLFLLSRVLGGKTFSGQLMRAVETMEHIRPHYVFMEEEDYGKHRKRVPLLNRMAGLFLAPSIMRWKLRANPPPAHRAVFVQSFELFPACSVLDPATPAILAHDSTNVLSYRLIRDTHPGPMASLACAVKSTLVTPAYRAGLNRAKVFLPRTHWCAGSLIEDFHVDPEKIMVTPGGVDMETWSPSPGDRESRRHAVPRLLWVGNDFLRKGGELLLETFVAHIHPRASLRIVSNDPSLKGRAWPEGVEHISGLGHGDKAALVEAYRDSDIFVFPTRKEHMGMVLTEACAMGLPIAATKVGGVGEAVREGENGTLLPLEAGADEWARAILDLVADQGKRERYGRRSREIAEREFSFGVFRSRVETALAKLINA